MEKLRTLIALDAFPALRQILLHMTIPFAIPLLQVASQELLEV